MKSILKPTATPIDVISSILDSDDELPDSYYEETSEIPAYLDDSRFDHIEIPWLNNCKPVAISNKNEPQQSTSQETPLTIQNVIEEPIVKEENKSKILISQGILSTRDLFFVKSIEDYCSEATLIWFIESLKYKVPDRFRKSCLAEDICCVEDNLAEVAPFDSLNANYYLNLIVSK